MARPPAHKWTFAARFRRHAFGRRSQPAVQRVREATAEIRNLARKDPALAAAGAVLLLEKVSPALEHADGSCGAIGTAVNHAVEICAKIIAEAPVNDETRDRWLDRLWEAHQNDEIPYIERLTDYWGELCASNSRASAWADRLIGTVQSVWSPNRKPGGYFHGTMACLSALFHAGRHEELIALLDKPPLSLWHYREWGVRALAAMGRKAESIRYAEASRGLNDNPIAIACACEDILLSSGLADEAYARYAIAANQGTTFLATFRVIAKKYPTQAPTKLLDALVEGDRKFKRPHPGPAQAAGRIQGG
jgi:tetratricopeptide (TPR) repeat protein